MRGLGRKMPLTFLCFLLGSLSIIGLPPLGGVWSKWYLVLAAAETEQVIFVGVLMISSLLNVAYLIPIVIRGFFSVPDSHRNDHHDHSNDAHDDPPANPGDASASNVWRVFGYEEAPLACVGALTFTAMGWFALFFYADTIYRFLLPLAGGRLP